MIFQLSTTGSNFETIMKRLKGKSCEESLSNSFSLYFNQKVERTVPNIEILRYSISNTVKK
jgi:hypothetical protein